MTGKIYGIGIGIGDPEDMTFKAARMIKEADTLILPRKDLDKCRAYQIVKQMVPEVEEKEKIALEFEMSKDKNVRDENHRKIYATAKELVLAGKTVAFLTIGDPAVYSTYSYIAELAQKDGIETAAVSGVSSITACANRLGITLCDDKEQLHVIPDAENIPEAIKLPGTKVIMKCGRNATLLKELLKDSGATVAAVSNCGMPDEQLFRGLDALPDDGNYMLTVIVK